MIKASRIKIVLAFLAIYLIWGSTFLAIRFAVETFPPFFMMGIRSLLAGLVLYLWSVKKGERVHREEIRPLIIIGLLFFVLGHGLLSWAQTTVASGIAAVLFASDPLWIGLIESISIKNVKLSKKQIIGLILGFGGVALLFLPTSGRNELQMDTLGVVMILLSAIFWSIGAVYSRVAKLPKSSTLTAGLELLIGGVILCVVGGLLGEFKDFQMSAISMRSLLAVGYLVVFGSIVAFTAYVWLLTATTATRVATHTYVNPVIAVLLGWAFAGEQFTTEALIACAVIILSVYLMLESKRARN
jgi:drug/metabolite transporter (DMT)-like permease